MGIIKQIITNEIRDAIGHEPVAEEMTVFMTYINDAVLTIEDRKITLADIGCAILDCRNENYKQCPHCEEWDLVDSYDWCKDQGCCMECRQETEEDIADFEIHCAKCEGRWGAVND